MHVSSAGGPGGFCEDARGCSGSTSGSQAAQLTGAASGSSEHSRQVPAGGSSENYREVSALPAGPYPVFLRAPMMQHVPLLLPGHAPHLHMVPAHMALPYGAVPVATPMQARPTSSVGPVGPKPSEAPRAKSTTSVRPSSAPTMPSMRPLNKPRPRVPITLPPPGFNPTAVPPNLTLMTPKVAHAHAKPSFASTRPPAPLVVLDETTDEEG